MQSTSLRAWLWPVCTPCVAYLFLAASRFVLIPEAPSTPDEQAFACPDDLSTIVSDSTFDNSDWTSVFITNIGTPPWEIDFATQVNDSEELDPVTSHYDDPADPPVRYVRFSRRGDPDPNALAVVGTFFNKTIVPVSGPYEYIRFTFDNFGSSQPIAPMIYQNGAYYQGPKWTALRNLGWHHVSSGCLRPSDFTPAKGSSPSIPDFSASLVVGYTLEWTTTDEFELRDHMIDNFRVAVDELVTLVDLSTGNREPFAINDYFVLETDGFGKTEGEFRPLDNDVDPENDSLSIVGFSSALWGSVSQTGLAYQGSPTFKYSAQLPLIDPPVSDGFDYTITDSQFQSTANVTIVFDYACWVLELQLFMGKAGIISTDFDIALVRRFRDEAMNATEAGARWVDYYYETAPEILSILVFERTDLAHRAITMIESLQPALENFLDGDGTTAIEPAQVDSISAFFSELRNSGSNRLRRLIDTEMERLGPLEDYAGRPVGEVLEAVLGNKIETAAEHFAPETAVSHSLFQNYPNPFSGTTRIQYALDESMPVLLAIYDVTGRRVRLLVDRKETRGLKSETWDGRNDLGDPVSTGAYFVRLVTPDRTASRIVIVTR